MPVVVRFARGPAGADIAAAALSQRSVLAEFGPYRPRSRAYRVLAPVTTGAWAVIATKPVRHHDSALYRPASTLNLCHRPIPSITLDVVIAKRVNVDADWYYNHRRYGSAQATRVAAIVDKGDFVRVHWISLTLAIAASLAGQTLLKIGSGAPSFVAQLFDLRTIFGLAIYGGSALLYIVALRRIPMSVALPFTAVSYVAAAVIGHFGFGEPLGLPRIAALALICMGVLMLAIV